MENYCKYCLDDHTENDQPLIYPCQCADCVHANCLTIWMMMRPQNSNKYQCEICHSNYIGVIMPPTPPISPANIPPPPPPDADDNHFVDIQDADDDVDDEYVDNYGEDDIGDEPDGVISLDFICCQCSWFEGTAYILGSIFGFSSSIVSTQSGYIYRRDIQLVFKIFCGLFIGMYLIGLTFTGRRYHKRCINRRRIQDRFADE